MPRTCALAGIDRANRPLLTAVVERIEADAVVKTARLDVSELGKMAPGLLVCDVDDVGVDSLELLRQFRFVLPDCVIAVYSGVMTIAWGRDCHLAGVNCVLAKDSSEADLTTGLRDALVSGCYTDPHFAA